MVEMPKPLTQTASNPCCSISCADMASCAPTATRGSGATKDWRSFWRFCSDVTLVMSISRRSHAESDDELSWADHVVEPAMSECIDELDHALADDALCVNSHRTDMRGQHDVRERGEGRVGPVALVL